MPNWMTYGKWFEWIIAHMRDGEDIEEAAQRLVATYAFVESRCRPIKDGPYRRLMSDMMRMRGSKQAALIQVHRRIHKYKLLELDV